MSPLLPVAVYGLRVPAGDEPIPAITDFPATFRITMAAIDPTAPPQLDAVSGTPPPRATLKLIREHLEADDEESDDDDDIDAIRARLGDAVSDEEESSDDEEHDEKNGGPSDPSKSKKARKEAAVKALLDAIKEDEDDMDVDKDAANGVNGKVNKGKGKAKDADEDDEDEEEDVDVDEFVICTLDPDKNYQQPLDITIGEDERVYFKVTGTHDIFLTGNFVLPPDDRHDDDYDSEDEDMDYDLSPDEDELYDEYEDEEEEDQLDDLEDPRITEVDSDEEAPKLVKADKKTKGKHKRVAEESDDEKASTLDDLIKNSLKPADAATNGNEKLSKKQAKKLKNNEGKAVPPAEDESAKKEKAPSAKTDKKVQFAKNLEQGPTGSPKIEAKASSKSEDKPKLGTKVVQGVTIDDRKLGTGRAAKKGDRVGMRYIGKLEKDGKIFDSNKKGPPFTFKLGAGEVIKGWDIGVAGMCVGGERRITIPASLGYGSKGMPGIPPNSNLVFDIKMLKLN